MDLRIGMSTSSGTATELGLCFEGGSVLVQGIRDATTTSFRIVIEYRWRHR